MSARREQEKSACCYCRTGALMTHRQGSSVKRRCPACSACTALDGKHGLAFSSHHSQLGGPNLALGRSHTMLTVFASTWCYAASILQSTPPMGRRLTWRLAGQTWWRL